MSADESAMAAKGLDDERRRRRLWRTFDDMHAVAVDSRADGDDDGNTQ